MYSETPELYGGFTTWALQAKVLDYFTVDGIEVDPYDGGRYEGDQLETLIVQLEAAIKEFEGKDENWPLAGEGLEAHRNQMKISHIPIQLPRDESIGTFKRAIELAHMALHGGEKLQFLGD